MTASAQKTVVSQSNQSIFDSVEQMPEFPGGMSALIDFLSSNIKYPEDAHKAGISGRVTTRFVINEDGSVSDVVIVRSANPLLDAEAIRVVSSMPNWTPGKVNGKAVKCRFTLPVTFRLQGNATSSTSTSNTPRTPVPNTPNSDGIYEIVDTPPTYPGGDAALLKFISDNIKYPEDAMKAGISGRVFTRFIINEDGSLSDIVVMRGVNSSLDAEAIRVVKAMPKWTPGKVDGKAVKVRYALPLVFKLQ